MEYIPTSLSPKVLDERSATIVLTHISSALAYMHSNGITHRDVKPDNILIQNDHGIFAKLADFGTASQGVLETFAGTSTYMAPELRKLPRRYNAKVDMFSLGLIALQCVTSWDACSYEIQPENLLAPRQHTYWMRKVILPNVTAAPEKFQPLLKGLLRKRPEKRWSAETCLKWFNRIAAGEEASSEKGHTAFENIPLDRNAPEVKADRAGEQSASSRKKRTASVLSSSDIPQEVLRRQAQRSANPSLSTARAGGLLPASESEMPDTLPPDNSSAVPPSPSPSWAPTPQNLEFDKEDDGDAPDETDYENDAKLTDDWYESDSDDPGTSSIYNL